MAQEVREGIYDLLAARGVSRRDFLKYCGSIAATLGLAEVYAPQIAAAVESAAKLQPAVWLDMGLCTGCTESTAQVGNPDVATIVLDILSINYMETISAAAGAQAEEAKAKTIEAGGYILIVEGTIMTGEGGNTLRIAGKTGNEHLEKLAAKAAAILAVGSCAVDGGWVAADPNPAGGMGVGAYLQSKGIKTPVINLPTCPVNPEWVVAILVDVLLEGKLADGSILNTLDDKGRPKLIYGSTKRAIARWVRRQCIKSQWAGACIPLNSIGPGIVRTPMVADMIATAEAREAMDQQVPMPCNYYLEPENVAYLLIWLSSVENTHVTGQTIYIDGGSDAALRGDNIWDLATG